MEQKEDMDLVFKNVQGAGVLDYVTSWYIRAAQYIKGTTIKAAFVSTNSIAQGEQVGILWKEMFEQYNMKIHFAHQTFRWNNDADGVAAVHCVIIGFANFDTSEKYVYEYENIGGEPAEVKVKNISPYLIEGSNIVVTKKTKPLCNVSEMVFGNMANDGGHLILNEDEKNDIIKKYPNASKYIKKFIGSEEFINGWHRYCLWLVDANPAEIKLIKPIIERIEKVKEHRLLSNRPATNKLAEKPHLFGEIRYSNSNFLLIPRVSSERRIFIPIGFMGADIIVNDRCAFVPNATLFEFGIIASSMHMAWIKYTCGRLKSDYNYSNQIVYNNYPFPKDCSDLQKKQVVLCAENLMKIREKYLKSGSVYADLYDPITFYMRKDLVDTHKALDKAVDACYGKATYTNDAKRIAFLFGEYERLILNEKSIKNVKK